MASLARFLRLPLSRKLAMVAHGWRLVVTQTAYRVLFASIGRGTILYRFGLLAGSENISIGKGTCVRYGCRFEIVDHGQAWRPEIRIGDHVNIEQNVHIVCHDRVTIGDGVSITGHCAIVDVTHPADGDESIRIGDAIHPGRSEVVIGAGSFLGFGSTVLPNVRIGRRCVVGAGSVVSRDVPDYSIVAGVPARIVGSTKGSDEARGA